MGRGCQHTCGGGAVAVVLGCIRQGRLLASPLVLKGCRVIRPITCEHCPRQAMNTCCSAARRPHDAQLGEKHCNSAATFFTPLHTFEPAAGGVLVGTAGWVGTGHSGHGAVAVPSWHAGHAAGSIVLLGRRHALLVALRAAGKSQRQALEGLHGVHQLSVDDDGGSGSARAFDRHGLEDLRQWQAGAAAVAAAAVAKQ